MHVQFFFPFSLKTEIAHPSVVVCNKVFFFLLVKRKKGKTIFCISPNKIVGFIHVTSGGRKLKVVLIFASYITEDSPLNIILISFPIKFFCNFITLSVFSLSILRRGNK